MEREAGAPPGLPGVGTLAFHEEELCTAGWFGVKDSVSILWSSSGALGHPLIRVCVCVCV